MLDIKEFKSQIQKYDVERPNLFTVLINMPSNASTLLKSEWSELGNPLSLFVQNTTLPGIGVITESVRRYGLGPSQKMPVGVAFSDVSVTYIADGGGRIYNLFYEWMDSIIPSHNKLAAPGNPQPESELKNLSYVMSYQNSYVCDIVISTYRGAPGKFTGFGLQQLAATVVTSAAGVPFVGSLLNSQGAKQHPLEKIRDVTLYKAFPTSISDMSLSASGGDSFSTFTVNFAFHNWSMTKYDTQEASEPAGLISSLRAGLRG